MAKTGAGARALVLGAAPSGVRAGQALARAGYDVELTDPDPDTARRVADMLARAGAAMTVGCGPVDPAGAAVIVDALEDDPDQRAGLLRDVVARAPGDTLLLTTAPELAEGRMIGFRIYAPAQLRSLVEITAGPGAPPAQVAAAFDLARRMDRHPVAAPVGRDSIGTRLMRRLYEAADNLLMDGAIPHELDEAMVEFGWDMGVYEAQDLIGLTVAYADRRAQEAGRDPARRYIPISDRMVEEGRLGKMAGVGWYRYPGGGGAVIDPLVEDLVREEAWFAGVTRREYSAQQMQDRLVLALIHEGAAMLADGTAAHAADIDLVSVAGLGFPASRGGVIAHADAQGIVWVAEALARLAEDDPVIWTPLVPIADCARTGGRLSDWAPAG